jgi:hypothetical protein
MVGGWVADWDVLNKLFWRAQSDTGQCRGTALIGGNTAWGLQPTDLRRDTTERRGCQDDCEYNVQYFNCTALLVK